MLRGLKRRLDEGKERKEQQRQEIERREQEAFQARLKAQREKQEIQSKVLAILEEGKVPDLHLSVDVPFKLQKNEKWILAVNNVSYAEMRTKREIKGRLVGASVRVMKGVSVRAGASRGTPVETDVLTPRGSGTFAVSTKHVFFHGERSFRIPMGKIVSVQGSPRGLEIVRDRASAQLEYFGIGGSDATFVADLIHLLPEVDFRRGQPEMQDVSTYLMYDLDVRRRYGRGRYSQRRIIGSASLPRNSKPLPTLRQGLCLW